MGFYVEDKIRMCFIAKLIRIWVHTILKIYIYFYHCISLDIELLTNIN